MRGEDEEICVSLCLDTKDIGRSGGARVGV